MKSRLSAFGVAYMAVFVAIWVAGVASSVLTIREILALEDVVSRQTVAVFALILVALAGITIFSFVFGAQPGHWVRAASIALFTGYAYCLQIAYRSVGTISGLSHAAWAFMIVFIALNVVWAARFKEMYRTSGRHSFFKEYFPDRGI